MSSCPPRRRLSEELLQTSHPDRINALAFPAGYSEVFATAAPGCIRVWHLDSCRELLRISVPNLECKCLAFAVVRRGARARRWWQCLACGDCFNPATTLRLAVGLRVCKI